MNIHYTLYVNAKYVHWSKDTKSLTEEIITIQLVWVVKIEAAPSSLHSMFLLPKYSNVSVDVFLFTTNTILSGHLRWIKARHDKRSSKKIFYFGRSINI